YEKAKEALETTGGDVIGAIILLEREAKPGTEKTFTEYKTYEEEPTKELNMDDLPDLEELGDKLKEIIEKGSVTRIQLRKGAKVLMSVPVTTGIAGGIIGAWVAPWIVIPGALAVYGTKCSIDIIKEDGTIETIFKRN
ncbi:MAG: DUF4342 domain-containing protein, partial [Solobacterium sp.]|nr:DUF4342 domain-containing protein [Solobacterium sp.]